MGADRVFVTRPWRRAGIDRLRAAGVSVSVWSGPKQASPPREELLAGVRAADVLVALLTETIDASVLDANPRLLGVANYAVGFDNVDLQAATARGIPVSNTPDVLTDTTADLTWALLLAAARRVTAGDRLVRAGGYHLWSPGLLLGEDVSPGGDGRRKVLGIVGYGRIGRAVARRAAGFDMEVLAFRRRPEALRDDPIARPVGLQELLSRADFVTVHLPLTPATRHLIGRRELSLMKSTAVLVNTARGAIVDEAALAEALRGGRIAAAGLDVFENEPRPHPDLLELDNVVLLPHLGSASRATRDRMALLAADNALAMLRCERAPHCVNPEVYRSDAWRHRCRRRSDASA